MSLQDGSIVYLDQVGDRLSLRADTNPSKVSHVDFFVQGVQIHTDHDRPYTIHGEEKGQYVPLTELTTPSNRLEIKVVPYLHDKEGRATDISIKIKTKSHKV
jgi:hypothetical protein